MEERWVRCSSAAQSSSAWPFVKVIVWWAELWVEVSIAAAEAVSHPRCASVSGVGWGWSRGGWTHRPTNEMVKSSSP